MIGVLNSEVDPKVLDSGVLYDALDDHDYLIALICAAFFNSIEYSPDDDRFGDMTPNQFREKINIILNTLEDDIWHALRKAEAECASGKHPFQAYKISDIP